LCAGGCGGRGKEARVDRDGPEFVFEEAEAGFGWERKLREEVEEEGGFAGAEEAGEDGDGDGGEGSHGGGRRGRFGMELMGTPIVNFGGCGGVHVGLEGC